MNKSALITNIINNLIHGLWFYNLVLEPKYNRKKTMLIIAAAVALSQVSMLFLSFLMQRQRSMEETSVSVAQFYLCGYCLTSLIFGIAFVCFMSASEPVKSLLLVSAYYSLWTFVYLLISVITDTYAGAGNCVIWGLRVGVNLPVLFLYQRWFKTKILRVCREIQIGYGTVAATSVFTFIVMTVVIFYNERVRRHDLLYIVTILSTGSMMVIIHVLLFRFIAQSDYANQLKQMQLHEKYLRVQIQSYEQMEQSARQTRHDFRHHNIVVAEYARKKDYQGILDYLQEYEEREEEKYCHTYCRNHVVNNLLSAYMNKAIQERIKVSTDIRLGETEEISDYDLVSILANILENAINACMKETGERQLELSLCQKGSKLVCICKNTCTAKVMIKDGIPWNQERTSVGINSIMCSVKKYDGSVNFEVAGGVFTCQVILYNAGSGKIKGGGRMAC